MSPDTSFHGRRVPIYIWLPIVLTCAAVGFVASTLWPARGIHGPRSEAPNQAPVTASKSEAVTGTSRHELSHDQPSVALADEADLPRPAVVASTAERDARVPDGGSVPRAPPAKQAAARTRPVHTDRSVARARRPQPTARQPTKATSSASLKTVPFFGPVFSLLQ
jgi:hypothetical protein